MIINLIGFKITFSNMGAHGAPSFISGGWPKLPPPTFSSESETSPLIGLKYLHFQEFGSVYFAVCNIYTIFSLVSKLTNNLFLTLLITPNSNSVPVPKFSHIKLEITVGTLHRNGGTVNDLMLIVKGLVCDG